MKKSTRIVKKLLALFLVVLMSIDSFAALISDNDGSAFVTKGEFDSLKKSFANQIDNYSKSIDSKIDGAIASYLAGMKIEKETNIDSKLYVANNIERVGFLKNWVTPTTVKGDKYELWSMWWLIVVCNAVLNGTTWYESAAFGNMMLPDNLHGAVLDPRTYGSTTQLIVQPKENTEYGSFGIDDGTWWNITPQVFCLMYYWHDGITKVVNSNVATNLRYVFPDMQDEWENANSNFGAKTYWTNARVTGFIDGDYPLGNLPATYRTSTKTINLNISSVNNGANANLLSGGNVSGTILSVKPENWARTSNECFATYDVSTGNGWKSIAFSQDNRYSSFYRADTISWPSGLPTKVRVYDKQTTILNAEDLILNKWSNVTSEKVQYFSGIPIFTTNNRSVVKLEIEFNSDENNGGTFQIKNSAFSNSSDLDTSNVVLYKDKEFKESYLDADRTWTGKTKSMTLYLDAKADETFWIKIKPNGNKPIYVNTKNDTLKAWEY